MINKNIIKIVKESKLNAYTVRNCYADLQLFREQIEIHTVSHRPYTQHKRKIKTYRLIFLGLAALYMTLAILFFYTLSPYMTNFVLGSYSFLLKNGVCALFAFASLASTVFSYFLSAEKEATQLIYRKTKLKLREVYKRNIAKAGLKRFIVIGKARQDLFNFKQVYHDSIDRLHHYKDETFHLIERILSSDSMDSSKQEHLLNQALLEMNDKMSDVLHRFKSPENLRLLTF